MNELNYKIISTGSKGNCVVIENIMIDCATSWKNIKEELYDIDILLISHCHSDHYRENIYKRIRKEFPNIICCMNRGTVEFSNADYDELIRDYQPISAAGLTITPFPLLHTVENHGFVWDFNGNHIVYATDTSSMENCPVDRKFDYVFLEANHDKYKLQHAFRKSKEYGYNAYGTSKSHLSKQDSLKFYLLNRASRDTPYIELHQSSRFY